MDFRYLPVMIYTCRYYIPTTDILYPMVYGLRNSEAQRRINDEIYSLMLNIAAELRRPDLVTYITGSYELKANQRDFLSLTLGQLGDFGGAHPMTIIKGLNMDVSTGKVYALKDLFKPNSNYIERISKIVEEQIEERGIMLLDEFKGISPDQDYYIVDNSLIIFFQLYEITPYVAGFPYFPIPIYELEDIINTDGPLDKMMGV
ncbi:protein of unknown function [Proteiniborus ethanoligenes]|uniref:DUF3298 domain-containing protein n=1 Tax=Proteiniborus ethanoligenes TaxID=415015 RepID=A0A1H3JUG7_9FIRM|nr:DUF3298 and DUF4163 domain-containing protein [Proteiniborus ethanoligenes]TAH62207.1 MAG: DUF3298 domain-containing protein [Gottschalkiaceae bacterium]SDY42988.1 protein of unknown function [Proteiniborus ethanoligenes]